MKTSIYARVSTSDQTNTIQVRELKEYVERRGWEVAGIFEDQMSGAKASRPGLNHLLADARLRKFDVVLVVWWIDFPGVPWSTVLALYRNCRPSGFALSPFPKGWTQINQIQPPSSSCTSLPL